MSNSYDYRIEMFYMIPTRKIELLKQQMNQGAKNKPIYFLYILLKKQFLCVITPHIVRPCNRVFAVFFYPYDKNSFCIKFLAFRCFNIEIVLKSWYSIIWPMKYHSGSYESISQYEGYVFILKCVLGKNSGQ